MEGKEILDKHGVPSQYQLAKRGVTRVSYKIVKFPRLPNVGILNMPHEMVSLWVHHSWIRSQFFFGSNTRLGFMDHDTILDKHVALSQNQLTMRMVNHVSLKL